jgi:hypothetical protein
LKNSDRIKGGTVANLNEFGYDVVDHQGTIIMHITTGDVRCDLGVCDHEEHREFDPKDAGVVTNIKT